VVRLFGNNVKGTNWLTHFTHWFTDSLNHLYAGDHLPPELEM